MDDKIWEKVEKIIDDLLQIPEDQRKSYIDEKCGDDKQLKREVTELLQSIFESEGWLEDPEGYKRDFYKELSKDEFEHFDQTIIGKKIGSYTIRKKIGEGGMGSVFLGERTDGEFEHRVAIKIIRHGHATEQNILRFRREQQILAGLNHPRIARLFDGGFTEDGYPYIIMEYIDGKPITEFCRANNCSIEEKVELFRKVLRAVQYAHENLVIHRDLKPGNILVTESREVKILDFGISKLLEEEESLSITRTGSRLLSLKYAAPEQIRQKNITTSTDLYSLGVMFYELISSEVPFNLEDQTRFESEQIILNHEPVKPSSKATTNQEKNILMGDLDAIALKAIRKEPEERYRMANEFLNELNNYQNGLPVSARNDTFRYRFQKFFKRNQNSVAVAVGILLLIIGFAGFYAYRITQERNIAQIEAQKAENVKNLLVELFRGNDPITGDAESTDLDQLLKSGTDEIMNRDLEPSVKIELLLTLTTIYQNITQFEKAQQLAEQSLRFAKDNFGENSLPVAESYIKLGGLEHDLGNYPEGKEYFLRAENILDQIADLSDPLYASLYHHLGLAEEQLGNYDSSHSLFQKSLDFLENQSAIDSSLYISNIKSLARGYYNLDNHQKGDSLLLLALNASKSFHGSDDVITSSILGDLGMYKMTRAEYQEAREYYNQSLEIKEKVYGEEGHPNYTATLTNLAVLEKQLGNYAVAESLFTRTMRIDEKLFGEEHPYVAMSKNHLAGIHFEREDFKQALEFQEEAMKVYIEAYGEDHYYLGAVFKNYGNLLSIIGKHENVESYFERSESIYNDYEETDKDTYAKLFKVKGEHYLRVGKYEEAAREFEKAADYFDEYHYDEYKRASAESLIKMAQAYVILEQTEYADLILKDVKSRIDTSSALANHPNIDKLFSETVDNLTSQLY